MRADVINVAADVSGIVVDVPVRDNQLVKKGDLLMQIDPDHYRIAVKQAESLVASRKATLEMRQLNARRRAEMDEMVVSRESRDDAHNTAAAAMADYEQPRLQLDAARLNLSAPGWWRRSTATSPTSTCTVATTRGSARRRWR